MMSEKTGCPACFNLKLKSPCSKSTKSTTTRGHEETSGVTGITGVKCVTSVTNRTTTHDFIFI